MRLPEGPMSTTRSSLAKGLSKHMAHASILSFRLRQYSSYVRTPVSGLNQPVKHPSSVAGRAERSPIHPSTIVTPSIVSRLQQIRKHRRKCEIRYCRCSCIQCGPARFQPTVFSCTGHTPIETRVLWCSSVTFMESSS